MSQADETIRSRQMTDFEDGTTGRWVKEVGAAGSSIALVGGNHVFRTPLVLVPQVQFETVLSQRIPTLPGQKYRFSLKARLHQPGEAHPVVTLRVEGQNGATTVIDDTDWLTLSIDFDAPLGLTDLSIAATYFNEGPGRAIELDDILVFAVLERSPGSE